MIACENDLCPVEWFHFSCVGRDDTGPGLIDELDYIQIWVDWCRFLVKRNPQKATAWAPSAVPKAYTGSQMLKK